MRALSRAFALVLAIPLLADTWTISQFQPELDTGGRAVAVAVNPIDSRIAIVASESGGVFMTRDDGATWTHIDAIRPLRMLDVAYAPGRGDVILVAAGNDMTTTNPVGIWRSGDGGRTWTQPMLPDACLAAPNTNAFNISFEPGSSRVFVATDCGLAVSDDLGVTWRSIRGPFSRQQLVSVKAAGGGVLHACTMFGLYRRPFETAGWVGPDTTVGGCSFNTQAIETSPYEPNVVFYVDGASRVFESDDGGFHWTQLANAVDPNRPRWIRASTLPGSSSTFQLFYGDGTTTFWQVCRRGGSSLRCGRTWTPMPMRPDSNGIAFHPTTGCTKYVVTDGGIHQNAASAPGAPCPWRFTQVKNGRSGYNALQLYEVAAQRQATVWRDDVYFGTQDNNLWASTDGGISWPGLVHWEGFALQVAPHRLDPGADTIVGVACADCAPFRAHRGFADAGAWSTPARVRDGLISSSFLIAPAVHAIAVQTSATELHIFTKREGASWTDAGRIPLLELRGKPTVVGPSTNPSILWGYKKPDVPGRGDRTGLGRIDNVLAGRATWVFVDRGAPDSIAGYCMGAATFACPTIYAGDPRDPNHMMVVDAADGTMHVTRDGLRWTRDDILNAQMRGFGATGSPLLISGNWGNVQSHVIAFHPRNAEIFVGTESAGIFYSADDGRTWRQVPNSRQITAVTSFAFGFDGEREREVVYVSTYGRGLWKLHRVPEPNLGSGHVTSGGTTIRSLPFYLDRFNPWARYVIADPITGGPLPFPIGPDDCPRCTLVLVDNGKPIAFDMNGQEVEPPAFSFNDQPGGAVFEDGKLLAVVALPPNAEEPAPPAQYEPVPPTSPAGPYIVLSGTIPGTPLPAIAIGESLAISGTGFCGKPDCGLVSVRIGDVVVAENVKVDDKGAFRTSVKIAERPASAPFAGAIPITVSQKELSDSSRFVLTRRESEIEEESEEQFHIVSAALRAEPADYSGPCPATIQFTGEIATAGGEGTLAYTFLRSDGATGPVEKISVDSGTTKVATTWTLSVPSYSGWEAIRIVSPQELKSNEATFTMQCK